MEMQLSSQSVCVECTKSWVVPSALNILGVMAHIHIHSTQERETGRSEEVQDQPDNIVKLRPG